MLIHNMAIKAALVTRRDCWSDSDQGGSTLHLMVSLPKLYPISELLPLYHTLLMQTFLFQSNLLSPLITQSKRPVLHAQRPSSSLK